MRNAGRIRSPTRSRGRDGQSGLSGRRSHDLLEWAAVNFLMVIEAYIPELQGSAPQPSSCCTSTGPAGFRSSIAGRCCAWGKIPRGRPRVCPTCCEADLWKVCGTSTEHAAWRKLDDTHGGQPTPPNGTVFGERSPCTPSNPKVTCRLASTPDNLFVITLLTITRWPA